MSESFVQKLRVQTEGAMRANEDALSSEETKSVEEQVARIKEEAMERASRGEFQFKVVLPRWHEAMIEKSVSLIRHAFQGAQIDYRVELPEWVDRSKARFMYDRNLMVNYRKHIVVVAW